ncbi:MAG: type III pantothenate kinase [Cryomorphaceae bacterium]|nr:MAG: type III pantothenate kinase [Cryomorphaceae bacterium]
MNLLIDIGNSKSKIAITKDYTILNEIHSSSKLIKKIKELFSNYKITHSSLSNVSIPNIELIEFLKTNSYFFDLKKNNHLPFKNPYKEGLVGDDRLALVCAAHKDYPNENVLIIDIGTCITYDIKTKNNEYLAGGISPGIKLRFDSINQGTFLIKKIKPNYPKDLKAYDTESSVNIGTLIGVQLEIEGFIKKYSSQYANLKVIITGGDSIYLSGIIKNTIFTSSNYVFKGLEYLIETNK